MNNQSPPDWDPKSNEVMRDQRAAYDDMRRRCPVAHSEFLGWSLFRHEDVTRVLHDHETFSNAVSQHLSVPNGMNPPEHTAYRRIIEPYFSPERMTAFEPVCRDIVVKLVRDLSALGKVEFMADMALPFAEQVQCPPAEAVSRTARPQPRPRGSWCPMQRLARPPGRAPSRQISLCARF